MEKVNEVVVAFLLNASWQTAVLALTGYAVTRGATARTRYAVLSVALALAKLTPFASFPPVGTAATSAGASLTRLVPRAQTNILTIIYLAGFLVAALRLALRGGRGLRLLAGSTSLENGIRVSPSVSAPMTIGRT